MTHLISQNDTELENRLSDSLVLELRKMSSLQLKAQASERQIKDDPYNYLEKEKLKVLLWNIITLAIPATITSLLDLITDITYLHYMGSLGNSLYVAAYGYANFWISVTSISLLCGVTTAQSTFSSQAFGKKDYRLVGEYHLRSRIIIFLFNLPLMFFSIYSTEIFIGFKINEDLAKTSGMLCIWSIPSVFLGTQLWITRGYMQAQGIYTPSTVANVISTLACPLYSWICTSLFGPIGIPLAKVVQYGINLVLLYLYIRRSEKLQASWFWFTKDSFRGWFPLIKLSLSSLLMICFEWWAWEITNFECGYLGNLFVAINICLIYSLACMYRFASGIGPSTCTLVGNAIGEGEIGKAKITAMISSILGFICLGIVLTILLIFRRTLGGLFTIDPEVQNGYLKFIVFVLFIEIIDAMNGILNNLLIALEKQQKATYGNFIAYYIVMVPLSYLFAFKLEMGLWGIWFAILFGTSCQCCSNLFFLFQEPWKKIAKRAIEKLQKASEELKENATPTPS